MGRWTTEISSKRGDDIEELKARRLKAGSDSKE
jgi:hypothetical protein